MNEPKPPLDLCVSIIARNAQRTIQRTICSVSGLARRVIVVDSGSTDATPDICRGLGSEVVHHEWEGYGQQKRFALGLCDATWALCLDSDESPDDPLANEIRRVVTADDQAVNGYAMNRRVWLEPGVNPFGPSARERLILTDACGVQYWHGPVTDIFVS